MQTHTYTPPISIDRGGIVCTGVKRCEEWYKIRGFWGKWVFKGLKNGYTAGKVGYLKKNTVKRPTKEVCMVKSDFARKVVSC